MDVTMNKDVKMSRLIHSIIPTILKCHYLVLQLLRG